MSRLVRALDPNNLRPVFNALSSARDAWRALREDGEFLGIARRALLPLPTDREPVLDPDPFPPFEPLVVSALRGMKVAVVISGGSGATSATVGVQRAFEEVGLEPAALSASSGAVLFTLPWACGIDSAAVARFWLGLRRADYVDVDWGALARSAGRAMGGWGGLLRGEALERSIRKLVGDRRLGETRLPFSMPVWNIDSNRVEVLGTRDTPDVPVAVAARVAIAIPIFVEPVQLGPHTYGDGGSSTSSRCGPCWRSPPTGCWGSTATSPQASRERTSPAGESARSAFSGRAASSAGRGWWRSPGSRPGSPGID